MRVETEHAVADIVVVGNFHLVEEDDILELSGVADCGSLTDDRAAADESALPDSRVLIDDAGPPYISAVKYRRALCDPDIISPLFEPVRGKPVSERNDKIGNIAEDLPWIGLPLKEFRCDRLVQIKQIGDGKISDLHFVLLFLRIFCACPRSCPPEPGSNGCLFDTSRSKQRRNCCS